MDRERSEHVRKVATGSCLIAAPTVLLLASVVHPDDKTDAADELAVIADNLGRWYAAHVLMFVGFILLVPAILGLAHMLHERRPTLAFVGGGLSMIGIVGVAAVTGADGFAGYYLAKHVGETSAGVAMMDDLMTGARIMPLLLTSLLVAAGIFVMAVGLVRAQVVAPWTAFALMLGAVAIDLGFPAGMAALIIAGSALMFVGMAPIGYEILTESDEEWAHTPEFHGFRRAPAMG